MTVKILEKEGYNISLIASLISIGIGVAAIISAFATWAVNSISIGSQQIGQLIILIIAGLVCPAIIFLLSFLGYKKILKGKNISLIFGIIIIVISALVIVISAVYSSIVIGYKLEKTGPVIALLLCFYLAIPVMGACVYGGIQEILYWRENK